MATLLSANGHTSTLTPAKGHAFTLTELQTIVGGFIETIHLPDGRVLVLNEDGKNLGLPNNTLATRVLHGAGGLPSDHVVGEAVIATRQELGE